MAAEEVPEIQEGKELEKRRLYQQLVQEESSRFLSEQQRQVTTRTEKLLSSDVQRREQMERVRRAVLRPISPEDLLAPGGVRDTYQKVWLVPKEAELLIQGKESEFQERVRKGRMIFDFEERPIDKSGRKHPSVRIQMERNLTDAIEGRCDGGTYKGYCLCDAQSDEVLAWATWTQPPRDYQQRKEGGVYYKEIARYLRHGVTGGKMEYNRTQRLRVKDYYEGIPEMLYFDTIISSVPFGAHRLFAEITKAMLSDRDDQYLRYILLYRLNALGVRAPRGDMSMGLIPVGANISSDRFFVERGCRTFATDYNPNGPTSLRIIGGKKYRLLPEWAWMIGSLLEVLQKSGKIWDDIQKSFG